MLRARIPVLDVTTPSRDRGGPRAARSEDIGIAMAPARMSPTDISRCSPTHPFAVKVPCQLASGNVRKTPPDEADEADEAQLIAFIKAHGLLENLVVRPDEPAADGADRFAVAAGRRRFEALKALTEAGTIDADHAVPCKIAANGDADELSLAEDVVRIAMHPADQVVAFSELARSGATVPQSPRASTSPNTWWSSGSTSATPRPSCSTTIASTRSTWRR